MEAEPVAVIGAGGHATVVVSTLLEAGYEVAGLFDDDPMLVGKTVLGCEILGKPEDAITAGFRHAILAIGDNLTRFQMTRRLSGMKWVTLIHPDAYVHSTSRIGPGTVVMLGGIVRPETTVGAHTIINTRAVVGHHSRVGDFVHLAAHSCLAGAALISIGAFLGLGVMVNPCMRVGAWSTVGSGGVVVDDIPSNVTAVGVPARVIKIHEPYEEIYG